MDVPPAGNPGDPTGTAPGDRDPMPPGPAVITGEAPVGQRPARHRSSLRTVVEWAAVIVGAVVVALVIRTFIAQAFYIPSESMEPLLARNDRVVVDKLTYGFSDVERGDVIVFSKPPTSTDGISDLIKRVVGLPGESIVIENGQVYIDGALLDEPYLPEGTFTAQGSGTPNPSADPTGTAPRCGVTDPCVVPEGYLFVMGDNRSNSKDSRWADVGYVSAEQLVGRAFVRVWPVDRIGGL